MADYIITLPDGSQFTIQSGTINNTYDIPLVGQDAINYGDDFATAFTRLLVNFADNTAPAFGTERLTGQLWYDTTPVTGGLRVYDGSTWDNIALESGIVTIDGNQDINDIKTFNDAPVFDASGAPFVVNDTTTVANLSAALLDGNAPTAFATAAQGIKADAAEVNIGNPPIDGYIYSSTAAGVRTWISPSAGSGTFEPVDIAAAASPNTMSVIISDDPTGSQDPMTTAGLTFNGSTNTLTTTTFVGNLTGTATNASNATLAATATVATTVTLTDESSDTTTFVAFANSATGDQQIHTNSGLAYNSSTETLTVTNLAGSGSNITGLNANNFSSGTLAVGRGGTGVTTATGTGSSVVLHTAPTFVTRITTPEIRNGASGVDIQYNSVDALGTQSFSATDNTAGAYVTDGGGTSRNVGFNDLPTNSDGTTTTVTLVQAEAGHSYRATNSSGTKIYQTLASDAAIPPGAVWIIRNFTTATGSVQIQGGSGSTIRHYNGSGTIVATVGSADPFALARGGVATIVKVADDEYEMWGIGLTGGA